MSRLAEQLLVEQLPDSLTRISAQMSSWQETQSLAVIVGKYHDDPDAAITALNQAIREQVIRLLAKVRTGLDVAQPSINEVTRINRNG